MKKILIVICLTLVISLFFFGCSNKNQNNNTTNSNTIDENNQIQVSDSDQTYQKEEEKLKIEDLKTGDGVETKVGDTISVNYVGTLTNGTKFDSSYDRNQPFEFILGTNQVIKGWDIGVIGMKIGGKRKLTIPPDLGYGTNATGNIPANSTLIFEIELLEIK